MQIPRTPEEGEGNEYANCLAERSTIGPRQSPQTSELYQPLLPSSPSAPLTAVVVMPRNAIVAVNAVGRPLVPPYPAGLAPLVIKQEGTGMVPAPGSVRV